MQKRRAALIWSIACLLGLAASRQASAAPEAEAGPKYVRLERDEAGEASALQTAIVRFVPAAEMPAGPTVDLVGAIHVGEKAYYEELNKRFAGYDVVLYELVAPPGTRIPKGTKPGKHPVALLQNGLKDLLGLEHQLQYVDYTRENMVHADMSPDDFSRSMNQRGESFTQLFFRMFAQAVKQQAAGEGNSKVSELDMLAALFDKDRAGTMKRILAEQFEGMDGVMGALSGPDGSTIITERNEVALEKLGEQIDKGHKKIAIFYGAGHMGDMEKHLADDFHLRRSKEEWLTAWKLSKPPRAPKPKKN